MKLPSFVKVGPFKFTISQETETWSSTNECQGRCNYNTHHIEVVTENRTISHVLDTLLHEISHAVWWSMDLADSDKEEPIVRRMSTGWTQVFVDNPELVKFINSSLNKIRRELH